MWETLESACDVAGKNAGKSADLSRLLAFAAIVLFIGAAIVVVQRRLSRRVTLPRLGVRGSEARTASKLCWQSERRAACKTTKQCYALSLTTYSLRAAIIEARPSDATTMHTRANTEAVGDAPPTMRAISRGISRSKMPTTSERR